MHNVAAIIAAYNEEMTVGHIVRTCVASNLFREVIVISDGSTDRTATRAREAGATLVHELPVKNGKGAALAHGVTHTDAPVLFFFDADLLGLHKRHLIAILDPVLKGKRVMNVGIRDRGVTLMQLSERLPLVGGERALLRGVFEGVVPRYMQGFMVETALNFYCRSRNLPYGSVQCYGLTIRRKMQKVGTWKGFVQYVQMWWQVGTAMVVVRVARLRGKF